MRSLGKVFNFSPKGSIVVKATMTPKIGNVACDNKGRPIGKVIRITGPVKAPYVLISPMAKDEMSMFRLAGKQIFIDDTYRQKPPRERRTPTRMSGPDRGRKPQRDQGNRGSRTHKQKGDRKPYGKRKDRR